MNPRQLLPAALSTVCLLLASCGANQAPRGSGAATPTSADDPAVSAARVADPDSSMPPAPMVETVADLEPRVAGSSLPGDSPVERQQVETPAPQLRVSGFDTESFRSSLADMRAALDESQRKRFDKAVLMLVSDVMHGERDQDPAGPVGSLLEGLASLEGRSATELLAMAESVDDFASGPPRKNANESAAIATLKNIASAQAQCQASGVIDTNRNGAGEYGSFAELAGVAAVRGTGGEEFISPPVLSAAFGNVENGVVVRSGYVFRMFLPVSEAGRYCGESPDGGAEHLGVHGPLSEVLWRAYAWPTDAGRSGRRAFYVDQSGDVLACDNSRNWSGPRYGPEAGAAIKPGEANETAANTTGQSGDTWIVVR